MFINFIGTVINLYPVRKTGFVIEGEGFIKMFKNI